MNLRYLWIWSVIAVGMLLPSLTDAEPATPQPRLLREAPGRQEYLLNGLYHFKVFDRMPGAEDHATGSGIYARIPGEWFNFLGNSDQFVDSQGKALARFPGSTTQNWKKMMPYGLYEIDFAMPSGIDGKTTILNLGGCQFFADVYCNGVKLGSQQMYENNFYDITRLLRKEGMNNLRIALRGFREDIRPYAGLVRDPINGGILDDVKLFVLDHAILCRFTALTTDLARGEATFSITSDNYSAKTQDGIMRLELGRDGKTIFSREIKVSLPPGKSRAQLAIPLQNIKLWEPDTPELYNVSLQVNGKDGIVLAAIPSAQTGFRQVEFKNTHFYLNGHVATLFGDSATRLSLLVSHCNGAYPEQQIASNRSMGYNFANLLTYLTPEAPLAAADRHGLMLMPVLRNDCDTIFWRHAVSPALTTLNGNKIPQADIDLFLKQYRDLNEIYALHPSVIGYARNFNWLCDAERAYQPQTVGIKEPVSNERSEFAEKIMKMTHEIDPSKVEYNHHGSGYGPVYTHNRYWSVGLPLQEKCDFVKLWSESAVSGKMPYMVTEGYMYAGWPSIYPKWGVSSRNPKWVGFHGQPFMLREIGAVQLGPEAYYNPRMASRTMIDDHIINIKRQTAAYRYYGVMGHLLHTDSYRGYVSGTIIPQKEALSDNTSGLVSRSDINIWQSEHPSTELTELGKTFRHAFSGFTFFIMGDVANPTAVEHNYYAGTEVTKSLLVINETGTERQPEFEITLRSPSQIVLQQKIPLKLQPGGRIMHPLKFKMPEVSVKTSLELTVKNGDAEQLFRLTVFPADREKIADAAQVAYYDTDGSLFSILSFYGLENARDLKKDPSLDGIRLLLVGRNALSIPFGKLAVTLQMAEWVGNGGRIITLEQNGDSVLGLALDKRRARNTFIAVPSHPAFAGLTDADLADWQGKSSLLTEFPAASPGFNWSDPLVTSTTGTVSSRVMEKPHIGNFLPLLESGYDLQFSPLLEWRERQGLILMSQLDLTGRIGKDPAATRLFGNLLRYALNTPTQQKTVLYAGDATGKAFLSAFMVELPELKNDAVIPPGGVVVVGAGADKVLTSDKVQKLLDNGVTLLCLPSFNELDLLPVKITPEKITVDKAYASLEMATQRTLPVSLSDLFWHDKFTFTGWKSVVPGNLNPLLDVIPCGKGRIIYCRIDPAVFKDHYFKMKPYRLWSALFTAAGVSLPPMAAPQLAGAGSNSAILLGSSSWFRLDPDKQGVDQHWMSPELPMIKPWKKIVVPGAWEKMPYLENFGPPNPPAAAPDYDGIAWYRFDVEVPKTLEGRPAILQLGVVDDYDTCYFNGVKIGGMGKAFGPNVYRTQRSYRVPENLIRYDGKNVIALRVEDTAGEGGIMSGKLQLEFFAGKALKSDMYLPEAGIMEVFGVTPYYNEQW